MVVTPSGTIPATTSPTEVESLPASTALTVPQPPPGAAIPGPSTKMHAPLADGTTDTFDEALGSLITRAWLIAMPC